MNGNPFVHYFAVCAFGWATAKCELEAKNRLAEQHNHRFYEDDRFEIIVYEVPVPEKSTYDIRNFKPVVDGIKCISRSDVPGIRKRRFNR